jgi:CysZ protein
VTPVRRNRGVQSGVGAALGGIGFVLGTPAVWPWALVPIAILLSLTCAVACGGVWGAGRLSGLMVGPQEDAWQTIAGWLVYLLLVGMALALAVLLALLVTQPLSGFALSRVAEAQERGLVGSTASVSPVRANVLSLQAWLVSLPFVFAIVGPLLIASFLFPAAVVVTAPLNLLVGGWLLAWNLVDYPLSNRGLGMRSRFRWVAENFSAFTGFGLFWAFLLPLPGLYLLVLPFGVAGAARLVVASES